MIRVLPVAFAATLFALPAFAQRVPPANALPLSQILAKIETNQGVRSFTEIEWEDDGYWDIRFLNADNRRTRARIDPVTGGSWSRTR